MGGGAGQSTASPRESGEPLSVIFGLQAVHLNWYAVLSLRLGLFGLFHGRGARWHRQEGGLINTIVPFICDTGFNLCLDYKLS